MFEDAEHSAWPDDTRDFARERCACLSWYMMINAYCSHEVKLTIIEGDNFGILLYTCFEGRNTFKHTGRGITVGNMPKILT